MSDTATVTGTELVIRRTFRASRERVFDAWTKPEHLLNWWRGASTYTTPFAEMDLRVGGKYRLAMQSPDADHPYVCFGEFVEVETPSRLVYSWAWEAPIPDVGDSLVTVEFHERGESTEVVLTHNRFNTVEDAEKHNQGWQACLDSLAGLLTS